MGTGYIAEIEKSWDSGAKTLVTKDYGWKRILVLELEKHLRLLRWDTSKEI